MADETPGEWAERMDAAAVSELKRRRRFRQDAAIRAVLLRDAFRRAEETLERARKRRGEPAGGEKDEGG